RTLFESPTLEAFAGAIETARLSQSGQKMSAILPASRDQALPLSFAQQRLWFIDQLEPGSSAYNVPIVTRMMGAFHKEALQHTLDELVRRHEVLRTTFPSLDGDPVQRISRAAEVALSIHDLSDLPVTEREEEARRLALQETQRPFDLERGPLFRA